MAEAQTFDTGEQISVSISMNGTRIVEFRRSVSTKKMWYHVGRLLPLFPGYSVCWGKSHDVDVRGEWPSVTFTKEGYAILSTHPRIRSSTKSCIGSARSI